MAHPRTPIWFSHSWVLTPAQLSHRASKLSRKHTTFVYQFSTGLQRQGARQGLDLYRTACFRADCPQRSSPMPIRMQKLHTTAVRCSSKNSRIPHISVHIAAASSGKGSKYRPEKSTVEYEPAKTEALGVEDEASSIFQKRRARPDSGQDAYFVARVGSSAASRETSFGVCDGVGGWLEHGIDPADFSHGLCSYMAKTSLEWSAQSDDESDRLKPQQLLETAYEKTVKDPQIKAGGSTACVAIAGSGGRIRIANLGDSGFTQMRNGSVLQYSNPQTHDFNTPFQMSLTPPEILSQAMIFGGLPLNDHPERADLSDLTMQHGDVLVLATDGVWDNLSSQDILALVSNQMRQSGAWRRRDRGIEVTDQLSTLVHRNSATSSQHDLRGGTIQSIIAATIVGDAKTASLDKKRDGPFAKAWQKHAPYDPYHGGKVDDITALVIISIEEGWKMEEDEQQQQQQPSKQQQATKAKL